MLGRRRRQWANINPILVQCLVFAVYSGSKHNTLIHCWLNLALKQRLSGWRGSQPFNMDYSHRHTYKIQCIFIHVIRNPSSNIPNSPTDTWDFSRYQNMNVKIYIFRALLSFGNIPGTIFANMVRILTFLIIKAKPTEVVEEFMLQDYWISIGEEI